MASLQSTRQLDDRLQFVTVDLQFLRVHVPFLRVDFCGFWGWIRDRAVGFSGGWKAPPGHGVVWPQLDADHGPLKLCHALNFG